MVEGRMQTRSWDAQDGTKKYRTEVVADRIQFGPKRDGAGGTVAPTPASASQAKAEDMPQDSGIDYPEENINVDDIPF